jgi:hypothetical protein
MGEAMAGGCPLDSALSPDLLWWLPGPELFAAEPVRRKREVFLWADRI